MKNTSEYKVARLNKSLIVNGIWNKMEWQNIEAIELTNFMGEIPEFRPVVKAKMMYDANNLYVIFKVKDRYVRCITDEINGPVWEDSCVEFFFSSDSNSFERYFNLEINCGGTPLMYYNVIPRKDYTVLAPDDIKQIEIVSTLPQIIDPEITERTTWVIECRIPLRLIRKYSKTIQPDFGVCWKANFYKIADKTSNKHYMTWSPIGQAEPDFHLPNYFGRLLFQ